ncbi:serine/threonine protein kinase [Nostoc sp. 'Lobaria pulmonaria (5183) cyanobiont']|uniref:serine/threonine protein kinase n=1 Tax=Nostoc sp. 'Lobaria pulmonaria (5183) cyanobiont' TaxID=1618022 RepID=UPI000CF336E1|nr:serine/threonine-protein kinase [Nostoc sp. 'Lobaria pulmonaria (5183) cyanobiont']AVH73426.1 serine/threonine protein kinase [Nostoc sp. 'Lobaria pulmonaria (5183) cyanobiont']
MTITLLNNRYQIIQVIGAGGFGETFLAEDVHMPSRRRCVIKQLKPIINNDPQTYQLIQQRFEREAATLEYLGESSHQIPKLYAYFSENGQFYLVQEWIHGQTLKKIVEAKGFESETAVRQILLSLLSVLDYVHSKGIIHRDIKPDNIILRPADGNPVLIDFGAVKETIRSVVNSPGYPTRSLVIGTPGYMPSEQAVGRPVYATDIYSLGLTAIYLLTGKHPQELLTDLKTGEILWLQFAPNVSSQLAAVLNQAIKPHAGDRYSTASKMLYALQSAASTSTVSFSPTATSTRQTQPLYSPQKNSAIPGSSTSGNWQKSAVIVGSLLIGGLIGAVAIPSIIRQQQPETTIGTNPTPSPESFPTSASTEPPVSSQTSPVPLMPSSSPRQRPTFNPPVVPIAQPEKEPVTLDTPAPIAVSTPQPEPKNEAAVPKPEVPSTPQNSDRSPSKLATTSQSVPAFATGTSRSDVEATLGKPNQDLRGAWGKTRAVVYKLVPNKIDLGYLFDRNSKVLRQTEVSFAQSVDPQIMETTLDGMLGGQTTKEIKQGLKQVQQRQSDNFSFTNGSVKGQIIRQECDFIYISIWDADLHNFVNPSTAKQC